MKAIVQIVGAQIACEQGCQDGWREAAEWAAGQLGGMFGDAVQVDYYDLFDPACPALPADARLPVIFVNGEAIINGGKIHLPRIRAKLRALGLEEL